MNFASLEPVLVAIGMADALGRPLEPLEEIAAETGMTLSAVRTACTFAHGAGLAHVVREDQPFTPLLMAAGRQYLARRGAVDEAVLGFLPFTIDDLYAREALMRAGSVLVDEFRHALLAGCGRQHAAALVPPAFAPAISDRHALDLFAAATALLARLEAEMPAACVAEELLAFELIGYADSWLEVERQRGALAADEAATARAHVPALLGLVEECEVLRMRDWKEPADAALALRDPGALDRRLETWFRPFAGSAPTGYFLAEEPA